MLQLPGLLKLQWHQISPLHLATPLQAPIAFDWRKIGMEA
jgi:hypothetical protein